MIVVQFGTLLLFRFLVQFALGVKWGRTSIAILHRESSQDFCQLCLLAKIQRYPLSIMFDKHAEVKFDVQLALVQTSLSSVSQLFMYWVSAFFRLYHEPPVRLSYLLI